MQLRQAIARVSLIFGDLSLHPLIFPHLQKKYYPSRYISSLFICVNPESAFDSLLRKHSCGGY
ncbi:hypothetical protein [Nostoc sp. NIES-3756]|uniref:hypothetical protein n=1 Tax=Nostoc sp. NIES-3756 TaxID=1751286 RepID=UPI0011DF1E48|nr:hypothetical protein [Nostoc sp. NIES-3756]